MTIFPQNFQLLISRNFFRLLNYSCFLWKTGQPENEAKPTPRLPGCHGEFGVSYGSSPLQSSVVDSILLSCIPEEKVLLPVAEQFCMDG